MSFSYIKIETREVVESRRNILSSEMNILNLITNIREYRDLRKSEAGKKTRLKTLVRQGITKVSGLINELPQTEPVKNIKEKIKTEEKKKKTIETELAEIRRKLATIGIQ